MKKDPAERPASLAVAMHALEDAAGLPNSSRAHAADRRSRGRARRIASHARRRAPHAPAMADALATYDGGERDRAGGQAPTVVAHRRDRRRRCSSRRRHRRIRRDARRRTSPHHSAAARRHRQRQHRAPPPKFITIHVTGAPAGAQVFGPGGPLGAAPDIQLERGERSLQLTLTADGFVTQALKVSPTADATLDVALEPEAGAAEEADQPQEAGRRRQAGPAPTKPHQDPYSRE